MIPQEVIAFLLLAFIIGLSMAATIPIYQKGQNLTSAVLTAQTVTSAGAISDSVTVFTLTTLIEEIDLSMSTNLEEISPLNATIENYVPVIDTYGVRLTILSVNDTNDPNELATAMWGANQYWKLVYVAGTATGSIETITLYCVKEDFSTGLRGKGRQIGTLSLRVIAHSTGLTRVVS